MPLIEEIAKIREQNTRDLYVYNICFNLANKRVTDMISEVVSEERKEALEALRGVLKYTYEEYLDVKLSVSLLEHNNNAMGAVSESDSQFLKDSKKELADAKSSLENIQTSLYNAKTSARAMVKKTADEVAKTPEGDASLASKKEKAQVAVRYCNSLESIDSQDFLDVIPITITESYVRQTRIELDKVSKDLKLLEGPVTLGEGNPEAEEELKGLFNKSASEVRLLTESRQAFRGVLQLAEASQKAAADSVLFGRAVDSLEAKELAQKELAKETALFASAEKAYKGAKNMQRNSSNLPELVDLANASVIKAKEVRGLKRAIKNKAATKVKELTAKAEEAVAEVSKTGVQTDDVSELTKRFDDALESVATSNKDIVNKIGSIQFFIIVAKDFLISRAKQTAEITTIAPNPNRSDKASFVEVLADELLEFVKVVSKRLDVSLEIVLEYQTAYEEVRAQLNSELLAKDKKQEFIELVDQVSVETASIDEGINKKAKELSAFSSVDPKIKPLLTLYEALKKAVNNDNAAAAGIHRKIVTYQSKPDEALNTKITPFMLQALQENIQGMIKVARDSKLASRKKKNPEVSSDAATADQRLVDRTRAVCEYYARVASNPSLETLKTSKDSLAKKMSEPIVGVSKFMKTQLFINIKRLEAVAKASEQKYKEYGFSYASNALLDRYVVDKARKELTNLIRNDPQNVSSSDRHIGKEGVEESKQSAAQEDARSAGVEETQKELSEEAEQFLNGIITVFTEEPSDAKKNKLEEAEIESLKVEFEEADRVSVKACNVLVQKLPKGVGSDVKEVMNSMASLFMHLHKRKDKMFSELKLAQSNPDLRSSIAEKKKLYDDVIDTINSALNHPLAVAKKELSLLDKASDKIKLRGLMTTFVRHLEPINENNVKELVTAMKTSNKCIELYKKHKEALLLQEQKETPCLDALGGTPERSNELRSHRNLGNTSSPQRSRSPQRKR